MEKIKIIVEIIGDSRNIFEMIVNEQELEIIEKFATEANKSAKETSLAALTISIKIKETGSEGKSLHSNSIKNLSSIIINPI